MLTVDQISLDQAMADPNYQFKSKHFSVLDQEAGYTAAEMQRFRSMLTSDPAHMMPNERGAAAFRIQMAMHKILFATAGGFPSSSPSMKELLAKQYGPASQGHIVQFKTRHQIRNTQGMIDPIVGKKTIRALDFILLRNGK